MEQDSGIPPWILNLASVKAQEMIDCKISVMKITPYMEKDGLWLSDDPSRVLSPRQFTVSGKMFHLAIHLLH